MLLRTWPSIRLVRIRGMKVLITGRTRLIGFVIKEDGGFIPDPDGNFIRVEELLSNQARVSRAEKAFYFTKDFDLLVLRLNSVVQEELHDEGERDIWWVVPFVSDVDQPYLYLSRRRDLDLRLMPVRGGYGVNVIASEEWEIREIGGDNKNRREEQLGLTRFGNHGRMARQNDLSRDPFAQPVAAEPRLLG